MYQTKPDQILRRKTHQKWNLDVKTAKEMEATLLERGFFWFVQSKFVSNENKKMN